MKNNTTNNVFLSCINVACACYRETRTFSTDDFNDNNDYQLNCEHCDEELHIQARTFPCILPAGALKLGDVCELLPNNDQPFNTDVVVKVTRDKKTGLKDSITIVRPYIHTDDVAYAYENNVQLTPYTGLETVNVVVLSRHFRLFTRKEVK